MKAVVREAEVSAYLARVYFVKLGFSSTGNRTCNRKFGQSVLIFKQARIHKAHCDLRFTTSSCLLCDAVTIGMVSGFDNLAVEQGSMYKIAM